MKHYKATMFEQSETLACAAWGVENLCVPHGGRGRIVALYPCGLHPNAKEAACDEAKRLNACADNQSFHVSKCGRWYCIMTSARIMVADFNSEIIPDAKQKANELCELLNNMSKKVGEV